MTMLDLRRKALLGLAAGALTATGLGLAAAPAGADGVGPGPALCFPVPGIAHTFPAGGQGYGFIQPAPADAHAFENVCSI
jgi:hypothetical protein